ncbi:helix-turn-helix transcriptional regulator [Mucilaginibacter yixingensis]|nr:helix-turn-helix transcriptional regulator [Mucilaginibacter yixingensis]
MKVIKNNDVDPMIVRLSNFSRALALPVRIYIIRQILDNQNHATRKELHQLPFKTELINTHLQELKQLGLITTLHENNTYVHSVDVNKFIMLSNSYLAIFEPIARLNAEAMELLRRPKLKKKKTVKKADEPTDPEAVGFGPYLRKQRQSARLNQTQLGKQLGISRKQLGKIENGLIVLDPGKLKTLALALGAPLTELIEQYRSSIIEMISKTAI